MKPYFMKHSLVLASILILLSVFSIAHAVRISTNLPGVTTGSGPVRFVANFYEFALMMGGILAFGAIVYGGIKYTFAAGDPSGQSEGKEWIKGALLGLLLLVGAWLVLNTINPDLVKLRLPALDTTTVQPHRRGGAGGGF